MKHTISTYTLSTLSLLVFSSVMFAFTSYAAPGDVDVRGKIKDSASNNVSGALVQISCGSTNTSDTTDSQGDFGVVFTSAECAEGDTVTINASHNGESGSESATVGNSLRVNFATLFLAPIAVPEFGAVSGAFAALSSGGAIWYLRKKLGM